MSSFVPTIYFIEKAEEMRKAIETLPRVKNRSEAIRYLSTIHDMASRIQQEAETWSNDLAQQMRHT